MSRRTRRKARGDVDGLRAQRARLIAEVADLEAQAAVLRPLVGILSRAGEGLGRYIGDAKRLIDAAVREVREASIEAALNGGGMPAGVRTALEAVSTLRAGLDEFEERVEAMLGSGDE